VFGDHDRGLAILAMTISSTAIFSAAARRVLALAGHIVVVVAARFACRRPNGVRHGLTASAKVARVQATAERKVDHRRDGRDDADK